MLSEREVMLLHEAGGSLALPQLLKHLKEALPHFGSNEKQALKEILRRVARRDSRDSVVYAASLRERGSLARSEGPIFLP